MFMKYADIYKINGCLIICSSKQTVTGLIILQEPYIKLPLETTNHKEVVESIFKCLNAFIKDVPHPTTWDTDGFFLKSIGIKSNKELHKNSISCGVEQYSENLVFTPTLNNGKGFNETGEKIVVENHESYEAIYQGLQKALALCR